MDTGETLRHGAICGYKSLFKPWKVASVDRGPGDRDPDGHDPDGRGRDPSDGRAPRDHARLPSIRRSSGPLRSGEQPIGRPGRAYPSSNLHAICNDFRPGTSSRQPKGYRGRDSSGGRAARGEAVFLW
jgi:hypothetical protein